VVVIAVGDSVPTTRSDVPLVAAALLALYPLIDVVASLIEAASSPSAARALRINAAISAVAALAIGAAAFGFDAGTTLAAFGVWAVVSGAIQFITALRHRSVEGGQLAMLISGGVSAFAGLGFVASSQGDESSLRVLAGYMAAGAVLFFVSAARKGARQRAA
jgi:uncharacterized membrane protein HdeD (DUF308 family)